LPAVVRDTIAYLPVARLLGERTAELHVALASRADLPAFAAEPLAPDEPAELAAVMGGRAASVLDLLARQIARVPEPVRDLADRVLAARERILSRFGALARTDLSVARIRVHGDYHLGQVLRAGEEFVIIDFEGEPTRPLAERRRKQIAVKDVAGMLRSFGYAAYAGLFAWAGDRTDAVARLEPWAWMWQSWASAAFLDGYRAAAGRAPFMPQRDVAFDTVLHAFLLDKVLYELHYELNNRPTWVGIPLSALRRMSAGDAPDVAGR
jgi:maltose alpha-D-glucosyltransferase/alpha-amylase